MTMNDERTVVMLDALRELVREMQRTDYRVAVNREEAASMFGLKPNSELFKSIECYLRRRQPKGAGGRVLYSVQSIREYMNDEMPEGVTRPLRQTRRSVR